MATYAVGDIQGCYDSLQALLGLIGFDSKKDRIYLLGDLVNRGPKSLDVLRWAMGLGDACLPVLGNHDLHLMGRAYGIREPKPRDTLESVLLAPDRDKLLEWLTHLPLIRQSGEYLFAHAGLLPQWSVPDAVSWANFASETMRKNPKAFLKDLFNSGYADVWRSSLSRETKALTAAAALTRIRTCDAEGRMNFQFSGAPSHAPGGHKPWFDLSIRKSRDAKVLFGHWAALGLNTGPSWTCLDTGCIWGRKLTAMRLEDGNLFAQEAVEVRN